MTPEGNPSWKRTSAEIIGLRRRYMRLKGLSAEAAAMIALLEVGRWKQRPDAKIDSRKEEGRS